jgi:hypothetical protein
MNYKILQYQFHLNKILIKTPKDLCQIEMKYLNMSNVWYYGTPGI